MHAIESRPLAPVSRDHESSTHTPPTPCHTPSTGPCLSSCSEPLGPLAMKAYSTLRRWEITGATGVQIVTIQSQHAYVAAWKPVLFPVQHLLQKLSPRLRLTQHGQPGETHNSVRPSCACVHPKCREEAPGSVRLTRCVWGLQMKGARVWAKVRWRCETLE